MESQKNFAALGALGEYPIPPTPSDPVELAYLLHSVVVFRSSSSLILVVGFWLSTIRKITVGGIVEQLIKIPSKLDGYWL